jgi:hypothetical protein
MMLRTCPREKEIKELVEHGQWPVAAATAAELRAHVDSCRSCGDLVLVAAAFQRARAEAVGEAKIGSAGALWWRAQLRRRSAVVEQIGRPILGAQIFAFAVNLVLAVGFVAWQARHGLAWLAWPIWSGWIAQLPQTTSLHLGSLSPASLWSSTLSSSGLSSLLTPLVMVPAAATLAILGGVVVFLASEKQ